jgi:hypothetical protein
MTKLASILFLLSTFQISALSASWYVSSTVGSSGDGTSWGTAWKTPSNIVWGSVAAGDTVYFDGGSSGLSYAAFSTITASGTAGNYITIARSTESGRDGIVTIAAPFGITGSYIKFDGGAYKLVSGTTYRCGIVFTCSGNTTSPVNAMGGGAINCSGNNPWFRYCYFNGTYGASQGNSLCVRNAGGFIADHCWFYQSSWEDQMSFEATTTGGSLRLTNNVWENNNRNPPETIPPAHRDVINAWTGSGGYSYYIIGNIMFNTTGHSSYQPQGDEFLLQVGYPTGSGVALTEIVAVNNVCYNTARFIALGSGNTGVSSATLKNNTIRNATFGPNGTSGFSYTDQNNLGTTFSTPNFTSSTDPLGADGIPFTDDDGFLITAGSAAIDTGSSVGVSTDIRSYTRTGTPDVGAYEFGASGGGGGSVPAINPVNATWTNGIGGTYQISATQSPTNYDASNVPAGLSVNTTSGVISGTPSATVTNTVTLAATNAIGGTITNVTFTVIPAQGQFGVSPSSRDYGWIPTNTTSDLTFTITNSGSGTLVTYATNATTPFSLVGNVSFSLASGATTNITVRYSPTSVASNYGTVAFSSGTTNVLTGYGYPIAPTTNWTMTSSLLVGMTSNSLNWISDTTDVSQDDPLNIENYAMFGWNAPSAGTIKLWGTTIATNGTSDSFFVGINSIPTSPSNIWDILPWQTNFVGRAYVHQRGTGTFDAPQYLTNSFPVLSGMNRIMVAQRESTTRIREMNIEFTPVTGSIAYIGTLITRRQ